MFRLIDSNGDGALSRKEINKGLDTLAQVHGLPEYDAFGVFWTSLRELDSKKSIFWGREVQKLQTHRNIAARPARPACPECQP